MLQALRREPILGGVDGWRRVEYRETANYSDPPSIRAVWETPMARPEAMAEFVRRYQPAYGPPTFRSKGVVAWKSAVPGAAVRAIFTTRRQRRVTSVLVEI